MESTNLTGSRIRTHRIMKGMKQAELAKEVGISASYLNLIEHNRRKIGGKLLINIAAIFEVDVSLLSQGAEANLISSLREVASDIGLSEQDLEQLEEFAEQYPGWAKELTQAHHRIATLERTVETLSDRLAHDPQLAASLHELLSTAAAIRSTASILATDREISPNWREKFHKNLDQDSRRLADSSKTLVNYLDSSQSYESGKTTTAPHEEMDLFFEENNYFFEQLESGRVEIDEIIAQSEILHSNASQNMTRVVLQQIEQDIKEVKLETLACKLETIGLNPIALAQEFNVSLPVIIRRLASFPQLQAGLVSCDRAGSLLLRKACQGFSIPRFGPVCPLWPLFDALAEPNQILHHNVIQVGREQQEFVCYSIAYNVTPPQYNKRPLTHALMLIVPKDKIDESDADLTDAHLLGSTCRICPHQTCEARREPSIMNEGV